MSGGAVGGLGSVPVPPAPDVVEVRLTLTRRQATLLAMACEELAWGGIVHTTGEGPQCDDIKAMANRVGHALAKVGVNPR